MAAGFVTGSAGSVEQATMIEAIAVMLEVRAEVVAARGEPMSATERDRLVEDVARLTAERIRHEHEHGIGSAPAYQGAGDKRAIAPSPAPTSPPRPYPITAGEVLKNPEAAVRDKLLRLRTLGYVGVVVGASDPMAIWSRLEALDLADLVDRVTPDRRIA